MICYRDMSFCNAAERCKNREKCGRFFSPEEEARAAEWWKTWNRPDQSPPVSYIDYSGQCALYEREPHDDNE